MPFRFRFESVLKVRRQERDVRQQSVATSQFRLQQLVTRQAELMADHFNALEELRTHQQLQSWFAAKIIQRKQHIEKLADCLTVATNAVLKAEADVNECFTRLVAADQAVHALEKLQEQHLKEYQYAQSRSIACEADDVTHGNLRAA